MALMNRGSGDGQPAAPGKRSDVDLLRRKLLGEIDIGELQQLDPSQQRLRLERVMGLLLTRERHILTAQGRRQLIKQVVNEALGLGPLEDLLEDKSITEIMVTGTEQIYVERGGRLEQVDARFTSHEQLMQTIDRIVAKVNRRVDESSPMVDARLPDGERVNVILPPLAVDGPQVTIRRFPRAYTVEDLIAKTTFDSVIAGLLEVCVRARLNILVSGGTGSGKTTLLNALSSFLGNHERIVTIEDAAELRLQQTHVVRLESRPPNVEGQGRVTVRDLVRNALRMRPDRIIVGEVRGGEALDMLQAMNTGHDGSLATVHANSVREAITRLETLATMSELQIPHEALSTQIYSAIDMIIQIERSLDGQRRISSVGVLPRGHWDVSSDVIEVARLVVTHDDHDFFDGHYEHRPLPETLRDRIRRSRQVTPDAFRPEGAPW